MSQVKINFKGKDYPFNLAKQDGKELWHIEDASILPPMFTTDRPLYATVPPEKEELIEQNFFYAGMGEIDFAHGYRYYNSPGADARRKGAVVCGPRVVKSTITVGTPAAPPIVYSGFETDGWQTGTVNVTGTPTYNDHNAAAARTDTYGGSIGGTDVAGYMYQDIASYANYKGRVVTFSAYCYVDNANNTVKVGIDDGVSAITYTATSNAVAWVQLTATKRISHVATRLRLILWANITGVGAVGYFDDTSSTVTNGTKGATVAFCEFNANLYAACGNILLQWSGTEWLEIYILPNDITDLCVWGEYLCIAQGIGEKYWYMDASYLLTESTIADGEMQFFSLVGETLWGNQTAYSVTSATNPLNGGSWDTETVIISTARVITDLLNHPDTVYVSTQDGLWNVDSTGDVLEVIPDLSQEKDTYTGVNFTKWRGSLYFPTGLHTLYEYEPGSSLSTAVVSSISPALSIPGQADFVGRVLAMAGDSNYLYVVLDNGTKVEILAGRWEAIGSLTGWWWHQIAEITLTDADKNVRSCCISALGGTKLLWLGCANTTDGIYYLHQPRFYGDVTVDDEYQMNKGGNLVTSWLLGEYAHDKKTFYSITVRTEDLDADHTIAVSYNLEGETGWTSLGTITTSPSATLYFASDVTSVKVQLKFALVSDSYVETPQLLGYTLRCVARPFNLEEGRITINQYGEFRMFGGAETSWRHSEYNDSEKNFYSITVLSQNLSPTTTMTLQYKLDDETLYTLHNSIIINESPTQTVYLPEDTVGKVLYVKFTEATNLIAYIIDGVIRPPRRKLMQFSVYLAGSNPLGTGGVTKDNVASKIKLLRELDENKWPVILTFDGVSYNVIIDNLIEDLTLDPPNKQREYVITIKALEAKIRE